MSSLFWLRTYITSTLQSLDVIDLDNFRLTCRPEPGPKIENSTFKKTVIATNYCEMDMSHVAEMLHVVWNAVS